ASAATSAGPATVTGLAGGCAVASCSCALRLMIGRVIRRYTTSTASRNTTSPISVSRISRLLSRLAAPNACAVLSPAKTCHPVPLAPHRSGDHHDLLAGPRIQHRALEQGGAHRARQPTGVPVTPRLAVGQRRAGHGPVARDDVDVAGGKGTRPAELQGASGGR